MRAIMINYFLVISALVIFTACGNHQNKKIESTRTNNLKATLVLNDDKESFGFQLASVPNDFPTYDSIKDNPVSVFIRCSNGNKIISQYGRGLTSYQDLNNPIVVNYQGSLSERRARVGDECSSDIRINTKEGQSTIPDLGNSGTPIFIAGAQPVSESVNFTYSTSDLFSAYMNLGAEIQSITINGEISD